MRRLLVVLVVLVLGLSIRGAQPVAAAIHECTVSPTGSMQQGTIIVLYVRADQSTTKFSIDGNFYGEHAGPEHTITFNTNDLSVGQHEIRCWARYDSPEWHASSPLYITITAAPGGQPRATTGGMDFDGYCRAIGYVNWRVNPNNAYTVTCYQDAREHTLDEDDMVALCAWLYEGSLPYPGLNATGDPNSWSCNATPTHISPRFVDPPSQPNPPAVNPPAANPPPQTNPPASGGTSGGSGGSGGTTAPPRGSGAACDAPEPVRVGGQGQVTPGDANRMRSGAGLSYGQVGRIPAGGIFDVLGGPICADGYRWWQVRYNGTTGWTVDGDQEYWILEVGAPTITGSPEQGTAHQNVPAGGGIQILTECELDVSTWASVSYFSDPLNALLLNAPSELLMYVEMILNVSGVLTQFSRLPDRLVWQHYLAQDGQTYVDLVGYRNGSETLREGVPDLVLTKDGLADVGGWDPASQIIVLCNLSPIAESVIEGIPLG